MQVVTDLHLHSKYSRAVSRDMVLSTMSVWGKRKGIDLLSASDWTHPLWLRELRAGLAEVSEGIYKLKNDPLQNSVFFFLSREISSIYTFNGKLRRIHNLLFAPNFSVVEKINAELVKRGCNLSSDGRPIIGLSSRQLLELALSIDKRVILIPCHAWTPHFGIYGSASGFDSIEECFGDLSKYIYGIETGISSDPEMNWLIGELANRSILSFSDAHSPAKMGREVTVFDLKELSYMEIGRAIARPLKSSKKDFVPQENDSKVAHTIEFYPEEGKYHYTGHRNCNIVKSPEDVKKDGPLCPTCGKRLTEGVLYRVEQLAGSFSLSGKKKQDEHAVLWTTYSDSSRPPFVRLVPLLEIVAQAQHATTSSEKVKNVYMLLCDTFDSELTVLLETPIKDIAQVAGQMVGEGVQKVRKGEIVIQPGFDGEYGKVAIWSETAEKESAPVKKDDTQLGLGI